MGGAEVREQESARRPPLVGVCGAADATRDNERHAEEVGRLLAERRAG